jgi:hypothetical protein
MISKDLQDSFPNISGKFFLPEGDHRIQLNGKNVLPSMSSRMEFIIDRFLEHEQIYQGGDLPTLKYSWFSILPAEGVRKTSRFNIPTNCDRLRQNFTGLRAGTLYEDKLLRWLGIDNYHVRESVKYDGLFIADFVQFRSTWWAKVGPRRI